MAKTKNKKKNTDNLDYDYYVDYVIIGGRKYESPLEAIAAVWSSIMDMDETIGTILCDIEDLQRDVAALKAIQKKKKGWLR